MKEWLDELRSAGVMHVASRLGLHRKRRRLSPCPACGVERSGTDKRPTVGVRGDDRGWKCHSCGTTGDAVDLVSYAVVGCRAGVAGSGFRKIRSWWLHGSAHSFPETPEYEPTRPPSEEIQRVLRACKRPSQVRLPGLAPFLAERGFQADTLRAGILPAPSWSGWEGIDWWPRGWIRKFPLVVPAYDGMGRIVSMHGRAIVDAVERKVTWPKGYDSGGLLFADPRYARRMLRNECTDADRLLIVEGFTDYLWATQTAPAKCAVIGIASGSAGALLLPTWPKGLNIYIGTDPDPTGDEYAVKVAAALSPHICRRLPLHSL